jgi:hypothetical protein
MLDGWLSTFHTGLGFPGFEQSSEGLKRLTLHRRALLGQRPPVCECGDAVGYVSRRSGFDSRTSAEGPVEKLMLTFFSSVAAPQILARRICTCEGQCAKGVDEWGHLQVDRDALEINTLTSTFL